MPIEFQCTRCREAIRVPDGAEGKRTKCPQCQDIQTVPGESFIAAQTPSKPETDNPFKDQAEASNPYVSPHASSPPTAPQTSRESRAAARARLYTPVVICQVMMLLMLLVVFLWAGFAFYIITDIPNAAGGAAEPWYLVVVAIAIFFQTGLIVIGLYGLRHAANLQSVAWAWVGLVVTAFIGLNCLLLLPFAIWGMVVLADADVKKAFRK